MKLYVWEGVFADHTPGLAVALAETKEEAIKEIIQEMRRRESWRPEESLASRRKELERYRPEVYSTTHPIGFYVSGGG